MIISKTIQENIKFYLQESGYIFSKTGLTNNIDIFIYTWSSLNEGYLLGKGQHFPNRLFWAGPCSHFSATAANDDHCS